MKTRPPKKRQLLDLWPQIQAPAVTPTPPGGSGPGKPSMFAHDLVERVRQRRREDEELILLLLADPQ